METINKLLTKAFPTVDGARRELTGSDDDINSMESTYQLLDTLYINMFLFCLLAAVFEFCRQWKSIYQNRSLRPKLIQNQRVPPDPGPYPFSWIPIVWSITDDEFLRMVGMDAYMLIRYLKLLFRIAMFFSFFGLTIMTPLYAGGGAGFVGWNKYSLANVPEGKGHDLLWVPVIFSYLFSMFFCQMMYIEYKNFVQKRVEYLIDDDPYTPDTPSQTNYTVMVERIPSFMKSAPMLEEFFERLFPGQVYSVELTLDLTELEILTAETQASRNNLEKSVALFHATGKRPTSLIHKTHFEDEHWAEHLPPNELEDAGSIYGLALCGFGLYDSIEFYSRDLDVMNDRVEAMQKEYIEKRQSLDEIEKSRILEVKNKLQDTLAQAVLGIPAAADAGATAAAAAIAGDSFRVESGSENLETGVATPMMNGEKTSANHENANAAVMTADGNMTTEASSPLLEKDLVGSFRNEMGLPAAQALASEGDKLALPPHCAFSDTYPERINTASSKVGGGGEFSKTPSSTTTGGMHARLARLHNHSAVKHIEDGAKFVGKAAKSGVEGIAKSSMRTAEIATKGALRGVLEATRTLELLTVGAYYKVASTAFVTFTSRIAACSSHQILLSNEHYTMEILPAPNPKDVIWSNVSIPERQINSRKAISDSTLVVGALFWSIVVTFITAVSNLESISEEFPSIQQYSDTELYKFLNNYLAIGVLLILLVILPAVFDFISRNYEGVKLESQIQNSIMTRFFYYTLANVYVSVGLGSIASSLHSILSHPSTILGILGASLPSFSIYFASLIVVKIFTGIPIEMLRIGPLLQVVAVKLWTDPKKCTRRELKSGAFAAVPMVYGWIYPNLLMVLMIMVTYCCISPLLLPLCALFFFLAFLMYKYQMLYVYINEYQSGGFMWYAVFNRSMVALLCGVFTLVCYLAIRMTFLSGPFYAIFPLPFGIIKFWYYCQSRFERPSMSLSLESAMDLDRRTEARRANRQPIPHDSFQKQMFRQPSLAEGRLKPMPYRRQKMGDSGTSFPVSVAMSPSPQRVQHGGGLHAAAMAGASVVDGSSAVFIEEDVLGDQKNEHEEQQVEEQLNELLQPDESSGVQSKRPRSVPVLPGATNAAAAEAADADIEKGIRSTNTSAHSSATKNPIKQAGCITPPPPPGGRGCGNNLEVTPINGSSGNRRTGKGESSDTKRDYGAVEYLNKHNK